MTVNSKITVILHLTNLKTNKKQMKTPVYFQLTDSKSKGTEINDLKILP